jgi:hypothetical protein
MAISGWTCSRNTTRRVTSKKFHRLKDCSTSTRELRMHKPLRLNRAIATIAFAITIALGQDNMSCVEEIEIPRYSFVARRAAQTGTVEVDFLIGQNGTAEDFRSTGPDPNLILEAEAFLKRAGSKFVPSCRGQRVHMLFTFRLEGEARFDPFSFVRFRPPNHFIVTSQPRIPNVDPMPVKPEKKD